ncbi:MAG: hypothetical protein ACYDBZ_03155 [Steroidobacteraceae bacterium]
MRFVVVLALICLAGCASEKLEQAPPAGVDFSGSWNLNVADSDDPQRLMQAQFNAPAAGQSGTSPSGGGGRGGRQGGAGGYPGSPAPVMPSVAFLSEGLRWPGKQLEIKQVAGVVAFISEGTHRVCQPTEGGHRHHPTARDGAPSGRDAPPRARDAPVAHCGWMEKTLIVRGGDPDDDRPPFEEHYSLSDDGRRLVEVVEFKGGRSSGFTMSRVWDRGQ